MITVRLADLTGETYSTVFNEQVGHTGHDTTHWGALIFSCGIMLFVTSQPWRVDIVSEWLVVGADMRMHSKDAVRPQGGCKDA